MAKSPVDKPAQLVTRISPDRKKLFKTACAADGVSMQFVLLAAIERRILRHEKTQICILDEIEHDA